MVDSQYFRLIARESSTVSLLGAALRRREPDIPGRWSLREDQVSTYSGQRPCAGGPDRRAGGPDQRRATRPPRSSQGGRQRPAQVDRGRHPRQRDLGDGGRPRCRRRGQGGARPVRLRADLDPLRTEEQAGRRPRGHLRQGRQGHRPDAVGLQRRPGVGDPQERRGARVRCRRRRRPRHRSAHARQCGERSLPRRPGSVAEHGLHGRRSEDRHHRHRHRLHPRRLRWPGHRGRLRRRERRGHRGR